MVDTFSYEHTQLLPKATGLAAEPMKVGRGWRGPSRWSQRRRGRCGEGVAIRECRCLGSDGGVAVVVIDGGRGVGAGRGGFRCAQGLRQ